jgi:replicative DNA helicase
MPGYADSGAPCPKLGRFRQRRPYPHVALPLPVAFPLWPITEGRCGCGNEKCARIGKHPAVSWGELKLGDPVPRPAPGAGYGLKTGASPKGSGFFVVDLDGPEAIETWARLCAEHSQATPETWTSATPRGLHLGFAHPGFSVPNSAGSVAPGIDIRGEGGFIVGPGSPHRSGAAYALVVDAPPAPAPAWLLEWLRARPASAEIQPEVGDVTDPEELEYRRGLFVDACKTMPPSVEGQAGDLALFNVVQRGAYDYALPIQTVLDVVREHFDPRCNPPWGKELDERVIHKARDAKTRSTRPRAEPPPREAAHVFGDAPPPKPVPFEKTAPSGLPIFPVHALPPALRDFVTTQSEFSQTPLDLSAMLVLGCCSASVAGKVEIEVEPGYCEPLNLYIVVALPPAERKSSTFADVFRPLREVERSLIEASAPLIADAQSKQALLIEQIQKRKSAFSKLARTDESQQWAQNQMAPTAGGGLALKEELARLEAELQAHEIPLEPQLIADDVTMERLAGLMAEQNGRMCIASPEGTLFGIVAGRYARNGQASFEVLLKGHAGDLLKVDRQSKDRPPVHIEKPCLTLALAVQPSVIAGLASDQSLRGQGLLARFLYSMPSSLVGARRIDTAPVPTHVRDAYYATIRGLARSDINGSAVFHQLDQTPKLTLSPEAHELHRAFRLEIEPRLHPKTGDLAEIGDWAGKWAGAVARVAGVLHCAAGWGVGTPVSAATMRSALEIGRYLLAHAATAFGLMLSPQEESDAHALLEWLARSKLQEFNLRNVAQLMRPQAIGRSRVRREAAIRELVERGYLSPINGHNSCWRVVGDLVGA